MGKEVIEYNDILKCELFLLLLSFGKLLTTKEFKYLMWRFGDHKKYKEIARLEGTGAGKQSIYWVVNYACKKLARVYGR